MGNLLTLAGTTLKALSLRAASALENCGAKNRLAQRLLPRFSRITSSGAFLPEIDGLRFVAISWVFVAHLLCTPGWGNLRPENPDGVLCFLYQRRQIGVPLFFIISGFILGMPFAKHYLGGGKAVSLPKYFLRRVTRLEPPYFIHLIFLTLFFIPAAMLGLTHNQPPASEVGSPIWYALKHGLASLCYQHKMIFDGKANPLNPGLWSLEVEIQFYILVPLLALLFAIRSAAYRRLVIVSIIVAFTCFALTPWASMNGRIDSTILTELQWFMTGFLLVDLMLTTPEEKLKPKLRWDLVSLIGWCALPLCEAHPATYGLTVPAAFLAYLGVFRGQVVGAFFRNPWITTIGGMCYTIYLYHNVILWRCTLITVPHLHVHNFQLNLLIQTFVVGAIVLGLCSILFLLFERPFMQRDWPQKAWTVGRRIYLNLAGRKTASSVVDVPVAHVPPTKDTSDGHR
jgi:peptidoglycan/LPS O-acetylase OafA/YrhL